MTPTKSIDKTLKELGDLYDFNREIKKFSFTSFNQPPSPTDHLSEGNTNYVTRNTTK